MYAAAMKMENERPMKNLHSATAAVPDAYSNIHALFYLLHLCCTCPLSRRTIDSLSLSLSISLCVCMCVCPQNISLFAEKLSAMASDKKEREREIERERESERERDTER
jgi:hypothetical protein